MIPGLKIILMGPPGSGKTHSIRTLIDADMEVFCILTEPNAINTLTNMRGASDKYKESLTNGQLHWKFVQPADADWASQAKTAKELSLFDLGTLQKRPAPDKRDYMQFVEVLNVCSNFKDELTGKELGPVDDLNPETQILVIDSLSGLNTMFLTMVCGSKASKTQPEWGAAIDAELRFIGHLTFGILSHVILIAHITRTVDEVMGGMHTMVGGLGKKAPQEIPKNFTDCIVSKNTSPPFIWSTADFQTDTKATTLEQREKIPPDFAPFLTEWRNRLALTTTGDNQ